MVSELSEAKQLVYTKKKILIILIIEIKYVTTMAARRTGRRMHSGLDKVLHSPECGDKKERRC